MVKSVKEILSDAFWIMPATPEYKAEGIPYITSKNIKNGYIDFGNVNYISEEDYEAISKNRPIKNGDILISMIGTLGETAEVTDQDGKFYGQNMFLVRLNSETINKRYFLNYFQSGAVKRALAGSQNQSTQKYLKANHIEDLQIPVLSIEEQAEIANRLDLLSLVITQRKTQLTSLDELIKARFIEMFGDGRSNLHGFDIIPFEKIVDGMVDIGSNGANKVVVEHLDMRDEEDYAMMIRFTNFTKNDFCNDVKYVSKEAYNFFEKSKVFGGELIFCKIGSAGQNYIMPYLNRPVSLGLNQIMVRIKSNVLMPYLYQYLHTDYGEYLISNCINGAVTKTITKTELKKLSVMLPPIELQQRFADFVHKVDKSKVAVQKALDETQTLFDSLMQEYFG